LTDKSLKETDDVKVVLLRSKTALDQLFTAVKIRMGVFAFLPKKGERCEVWVEGDWWMTRVVKKIIPRSSAAKKPRKAPALNNQRKRRCKDCGGSSLCEHQKEWSRRKDCVGGGFFEHQKERRRCKDCGGSGLCNHERAEPLQRLQRQQDLRAPAAEEQVQGLRQ